MFSQPHREVRGDLYEQRIEDGIGSSETLHDVLKDGSHWRRLAQTCSFELREVFVFSIIGSNGSSSHKLILCFMTEYVQRDVNTSLELCRVHAVSELVILKREAWVRSYIQSVSVYLKTKHAASYRFRSS